MKLFFKSTNVVIIIVLSFIANISTYLIVQNYSMCSDSTLALRCGQEHVYELRGYPVSFHSTLVSDTQNIGNRLVQGPQEDGLIYGSLIANQLVWFILLFVGYVMLIMLIKKIKNKK